MQYAPEPVECLILNLTVKSFAKIGCAGVLIEDQLSPKRCGHTPGKDVVSREEAFDRIRASVDAREYKEVTESEDLISICPSRTLPTVPTFVFVPAILSTFSTIS